MVHVNLLTSQTYTWPTDFSVKAGFLFLVQTFVKLPKICIRHHPPHPPPKEKKRKEKVKSYIGTTGIALSSGELNLEPPIRA